MKFKKILVFLILLLIFPLSIKANNEYRDVISDIVENKDTDKVTVYLFHQNGCPHCEAEIEFLKKMEKKYDIKVLKYEITSSDKNYNNMELAEQRFMLNLDSVPFTVIGTKYFSGFNDSVGLDIENTIKSYLGEDVDLNVKKLPIIGDVNIKNVSIPLAAIVLGLADGFNPCAMWILLFLISMLFNMKDRKRMWILGITFLVSSALVYFLSMVGFNYLLGLFKANIIRKLIAVVALIGGILNIRSYIKTKDDGCHVVDSKKRKKYFERIKKFTTEKNFILALLGVVALAFSVNIVELACSAGFPAIFLEILNINDLSNLQDIIYILLYILFFLLDDIVVFVIAMKTLELTGISTKYNRLSHLIGGILMILIGILLIFKPEWIMFNF